jgi:hypothetical protein
MDCRKYHSQFNSYLDGDLLSPEREELQTHLKECLLCYRQWNSLQKTQELLRRLPALDPPEHLNAVVMARLKDRGFRQPLWFLPSLPRWLPLGVGAAVLLFISVALWQVMPSQYPWQLLFPSSRKNLAASSGPAKPPREDITTRKGESDSSAPVMVLRVKDFSRADQELESMLRSFQGPMLQDPGTKRILHSGSARLIDVQVPGQRFSHLLRELDKIGHLDHSELERQRLANPQQKKSISIRIVIIGNGSETEIRRLSE